jgi:hypothetical protein
VNTKVLWLRVEEWQAYGTIALVLVTAVYVALTGKLAKSARESADASRESAKFAERSAHSAERSLLLQIMPLIFGHEVRRVGGVETGLRTQVLLFSSGDSPAFNLVVTVRQDSSEGTAPPLSHITPGRDREWQIELDPPFEISRGQPYTVEVTYLDALGNGYRTQRDSLLRGESHTRIDRWDESQSTWVSLL